jgi:predicted GNAT family acetyltransferase
MYALRELRVPGPVAGDFRSAGRDDVDLVVQWAEEFAQEAGVPGPTPETIAYRIGLGEFWLWHHDAPVSMAAHTPPVEGVVRVQAVYTPPDRRQRGYSGSCVGRLSEHLRVQGHQCILFTDLANPVSNSIYRRLGYEAVSEVLHYEFATNPISARSPGA